MGYWMRWHNVRYELGKRVDRFCLWLAAKMPAKRGKELRVGKRRKVRL